MQPSLEHRDDNVDESSADIRGRNTSATFTFLRHSQKNSGNILNNGESGISTSGISPEGVERAEKIGSQIFTGRNINKGYVTQVERTRETLNAALSAAAIVEDTDVLEPGKTTNAFFSLPGMPISPESLKTYNGIFKRNQENYIRNNFRGNTFEELTPNQQEEVAEIAEEEALQWYLDFDNEQPDPNTPSPREHAAFVAYKMNKFINLTDYIASEKVIDLVSVGHKTSTEAFLKYVIERDEGDKTITGFNSLEEIGGSLKILDGWELKIVNDDQGEKHCTIRLQRENGQTQVYGLNLEVLRTLAHEHMKSEKIKPKRIDG